MNFRGQALIESIPIFMVFVGLFVALISFTQWFLIRQKLIIAAREGAILYSSGRLTAPEVRSRVARYLKSGSLALRDEQFRVDVGRWDGNAAQAWMMQLDEVRVIYRPYCRLQRYFQKTMEEKCVIKHAPHYGAPVQTLYGPAIPW